MYEMHAGQCLERGPTKTGGLYMQDQEGWYDFFAQSVNQDNEGYCDATTVGFKHVACREDGARDRVQAQRRQHQQAAGLEAQQVEHPEVLAHGHTDRQVRPRVPRRPLPQLRAQRVNEPS